MEVIIGLIIIGFIVVVAAAVLQNKTTSSSGEFSYIQKYQFLSKAERSFFGALVQAIGAHGVVFAKIRVADVLTPKKSIDNSAWQKAFNRISSKHFDFVVCHPSTLKPLVAVELDDASHQSRSAAERDKVKNSAAKSAKLPLVRFKAKYSYVISELQQLLSAHVPGIGAHALSEQQPQAIPFESSSETISPSCPKCNSSMVLRESKKGKRAGTKFWGCSRFPDCRSVQADI